MEILEIIDFLNSFLRPSDYSDYCINGIQVEGRKEVKKIVTGVSASMDLFEKSVEKKADLIIVHHGLFWKPGVLKIDGFLKRRLKILFDNNISLAAYHLPLDMHPEIGNSVSLLRRLGFEKIERFPLKDSSNLYLYAGFYEKELSVSQFKDKLLAINDHFFEFSFSEKPVKSVGVITGAGQKGIYDAVSLNLDAYITGETSEYIMYISKEENIHFFGLGHYATERFGVLNLGRVLEEKFNLDVEFIEIFNPA